MHFSRTFGIILSIFLLGAVAGYSETGTPSITTNDATAVAASSAELHGTINTGGNAGAGWFEWGTTSSLGKRTDPQVFAVGTTSVTLVTSIRDLAPHTTFYFRAVLYQGVAGAPVINGEIKTFTTAGDAVPTTNVPAANVVATTGDATAVTSSGATLNGSINPGSGSVMVWFDWGTSTSLGSRTEAQTIPGGTTTVAVTFSLSKLQTHTVYYFRLDAYRSGGVYSLGDIKTFTTSDAPAEAPMTVTTGDASAITFNSATLNGKITAGGSPFGAWFEYGTTPSLGKRTEIHTFSDNTTSANLTQTLNDLHSNTTYYFRAVGYRRGANVLGDISTFTTRVATTRPETSEVERGEVKSGYLVITPDGSSDAPTVTFTYGTISQGAVQSQAGFVPATMATDASMFVEVIPSIGRNIGVAIVNPASNVNAVTLTLRDENGFILGSPKNISVAAHQQVAKFVNELFGADVISNGFRGSLRMQSASPFAVMGLRFAGAVFSALPVAVNTGISGVPSTTLAAGPTANSPAAGTVGGTTAVLIPEFAIAGGWATQVALVNNSNATLAGRIDVFDTSGRPMPVKMNGEIRSTFTYSIPVGGTFILSPRDLNGQSPL